MSDPAEHHLTKFRIAAEHASLSGHFPGRPVVPAVVILGQVLNFAAARFGDDYRASNLDQAKFPAPLLPEEEAEISLHRAGDLIRFTVTRDRTAIAQGALRLAATVP